MGKLRGALVRAGSGLAIAGLAGCAGPVTVPEPLATELPASVAAWVIGEYLRVEFAGADPVPMHAGTPVLRVGPAGFALCAGRSMPGAFRFAHDCRVLPPAEHAGWLDLTSCHVLDVAGGGRTDNGAEDQLYVTVLSDGMTTRVHLRMAGSCARDAWLADEIARLLRVAEWIRHAQLALQSDRNVEPMPAPVTARADAARHRWLRAWWHLTLSRVHARAGALAAARDEARCALSLQPGLVLADRLLTHLDDLAAREGESNDALARTLDPVMAPDAIALWRIWRQRARSSNPGGLAQQRARAALARDDLRAARRQAAQAERITDGHASVLQLLAEIDRQRGDPQLAFEALLAGYEKHPAPELLFPLLDLLIDLERREEALSLLAASWHGDAPPDAAGSQPRLLSLAQELDPQVATRILITAGVRGPAWGPVERWIATGVDDAALAIALRRLSPWPLLQIGSFESEAPGSPDFRQAPGVAPMR